MQNIGYDKRSSGLTYTMFGYSIVETIVHRAGKSFWEPAVDSPALLSLLGNSEAIRLLKEGLHVSMKGTRFATVVWFRLKRPELPCLSV